MTELLRTCHWCHVMAHESFESDEIAKILNKHFICIKVDKEERPDIDSIYMSVCQVFTGSGGWPTSIFMTPQQKPFFAGTYFPKNSSYGMIGFKDLLGAIQKKWKTDRKTLLETANDVVSHLNSQARSQGEYEPEGDLIRLAYEQYVSSYDKKFGGFGKAPKFPSPHNLLFLLTHYEKTRDKQALEIAQNTLLQMYKGGLFDHIGYGFSRYSTDPYFLVPHFEKMLYDNALLIMSYCTAYSITKKSFYLDVAKKTAYYIMREMTDPSGGFYSAQDADSEGIEGKYYVFKPSEITNILGDEIGSEFNHYYDITERGNFEGNSIPNLLKNDDITDKFNSYLPAIYEYRKGRTKLHLDDKILTSWNSLMIAAMASLYRVSGDEKYLNAAKSAQQFIENNLYEKDTLFVSYRDGKRGEKGFLDDYATYTFCLIALYEATLDNSYLEKAKLICQKAISNFYDIEEGGFWLYGKENEQLIFRPKETYDGAIPSGNSFMAHNLVRLFYLTGDSDIHSIAKKQLKFISHDAKKYCAGYSMFLLALSDFLDCPKKVTVVLKDRVDLDYLSPKIPLGAVIIVLEKQTPDYPLINDKTTFYVCQNHSCLPPSNHLEGLE